MAEVTMDQLISIVIPVYNQEKELELALLSIKNQTYKNIEVIIEEDKLHEGAPVMRNRGLVKAKGEYVIFWDADVVAETEMLEKMYETLQKNPGVSYVYCDYVSCIMYHVSKKMSARNFDVKKLQENNFIHSTSLIRKKDAIMWDERLKRFQDWDLWLSMAEQGKVGIYIPEALFTIISKGTISFWLPSFAYKKPWRWLPGILTKVRKYEEAKKIVMKKHKLSL